MSLKKRFLTNLILPTILLGGLLANVSAQLNRPLTTDEEFDLEHDEGTDDFYTEEPSDLDIKPMMINRSTTKYLPDLLTYDTGTSINKDYDAFKVLNNDVEYQALGETVFENINGETCYTYCYYRKKSTAPNNPNVANGILLYDTIRYKLLHPEEDIKVFFSYYRISPTVSVCVLPQSRYYGYMRALYDTDYDGWGFVRISYLLVECARMGIEVNILGQLNSYGIKQYNDKGELVKVAEPAFTTYFNNAVKGDCYDEFAPGKKVSDFLKCVRVGWNISDKGGVDMMHLKVCGTSAHIDEHGREHHYTVYTSASNLDTIDYRGSNAGNWDQSGSIVTDHFYLYKCFYNYIQLAMKYSYQEGMYEFKDIINERNTEQVRLQREGRIDDIDIDKLVAYAGTETDKVFELYLTPVEDSL